VTWHVAGAADVAAACVLAGLRVLVAPLKTLGGVARAGCRRAGPVSPGAPASGLVT
jgi:hypothetical protein